ncbi:hypothetical protein DFH29DRAFT_1004743 [Suillus ampliporus]|nr:hypothetical protein DFH29DRAFT_1004743 [Suillus ampliporus]
MYLEEPNPQVNSEVHVFSFHHGKGATSFNFHETLTNHYGCIVEPFTAFLKGTFSSATATKTSPQVVSNITIVDPAISITVPVPSPTTPVVPQSSPLATLYTLGENIMLPNRIHPLYSLDKLLSFDPDSIDFLHMDTGSFSLPMLSALPPSPAHSYLLILPALPMDGQDFPMSSHDRDPTTSSASFISSPSHFAELSQSAPKESQPPHPHPVTRGMIIPFIYDKFDISSSASPAPQMAAKVPEVAMPLTSEVSFDLSILIYSMSLPSAAPSASEEFGNFSVSLPVATTLVSSSP